MVLIALNLTATTFIHAENQKTGKPSIAIVSLDVSGLPYENTTLGSLARIELEKTGKYEVLDKYDVASIMKANNVNPAEAFGKTALVKVGKLLQADKMMTGSVELFGEKIIFTMRLIDVEQERIEKISVLEYVDNQKYIERMVRFSVNDLLGLENNPQELEQLSSFDTPIIAKESTFSLNGPRFGIQVFGGEVADRLTADKADGGFNANSFASVFGYQFEKQYISAGEFQALFEFIASINGIESGMVVPSLAILHGMRFKGWEFGVGPVFRLNRTAKGYYDANGIWVAEDNIPEGFESTPLTERIDSDGTIGLNTGLIFALGKTFTSGHLHFPVNVYYSPMPEYDSHVVGIMLGFTIAK
jgi:hypothetical protein